MKPSDSWLLCNICRCDYIFFWSNAGRYIKKYKKENKSRDFWRNLPFMQNSKSWYFGYSKTSDIFRAYMFLSL